jgi:hypothetical protein
MGAAVIDGGDVQMHRFEIRLDVPLGRKEARTRGIDETVSRLVVQGRLQFLCEFIVRCNQGGESAFVHAVGPFVSLDKLASPDHGNQVQIHAEFECVSVKSAAELEWVLSRWDSEILVIFFATPPTARSIVTSLSKLEPKWWQWSEEGYEAPYLKQLKQSNPFFFFAPTRSALEVMGTKSTVARCFATLSDMITKDLL